MKVRVAEIRVPEKRLRATQPETVKRIAEGMRDLDQLQAIGLDEDLNLVFGLHRYLAAKVNGWELIEAEVRPYSAREAKLAEIQENLFRGELSALERAEHIQAMNEELDALGLRAKRGQRVTKSEKFSHLKTGEEMAKEMGVTSRTLRRDSKIASSIPAPLREMVRGSSLENNQRELERLGRRPLMEQVAAIMVTRARDAAGIKSPGVRDAIRYVTRRKNRQLAEDAPAPRQSMSDGSPSGYRTIIMDPPWDGADSGDVDPFAKLAPAYSTMRVEDMASLPVGDLAEPDDCHLYLWVTSRTLRHGLDLLEAWGFRHVTNLVWVKHRIGTGRYFVHQHELVLFGMKGTRLLAETGVPDVFYGKRTSHSTKPPEFYDLVRKVSPGPRLEMFARQENQGFDSWGAQATTTKEIPA